MKLSSRNLQLPTELVPLMRALLDARGYSCTRILQERDRLVEETLSLFLFLFEDRDETV